MPSFSISNTVHMYQHTEANMTKKYCDTFRATIPRLGTNKKDDTPQVCVISWTFIKFYFFYKFNLAKKYV